MVFHRAIFTIFMCFVALDGRHWPLRCQTLSNTVTINTDPHTHILNVSAQWHDFVDSVVDFFFFFLIVFQTHHIRHNGFRWKTVNGKIFLWMGKTRFLCVKSDRILFLCGMRTFCMWVSCLLCVCVCTCTYLSHLIRETQNNILNFFFRNKVLSQSMTNLCFGAIHDGQ